MDAKKTYFVIVVNAVFSAASYQRVWYNMRDFEGLAAAVVDKRSLIICSMHKPGLRNLSLCLLHL